MRSNKIPKPTVHYFKLEKSFSQVWHYKLQKTKFGKSKLSDKIHISENREFAKSQPEYWLKTRDGKRWSKRYATGLFKTQYSTVFMGDLEMKKDLVIVSINRKEDSLRVFVFDNYYSNNPSKAFNYLTAMLS